jgi:glucose-induced degradation protein 8
MHHSQLFVGGDDCAKPSVFKMISFIFCGVCWRWLLTILLAEQILDTNPALYFHLQQQKLIEYIRQGKITEALRFAQEELAPRGEESPEFLAELERTMALLAFESSGAVPPAISDLLSPGQRMKTAGEVNAAILESLSQGREAKLVALLKLLQWAESLLGERAVFPKVRRMECDGRGADS